MKKLKHSAGELHLELGSPNEKQKRFLTSTARYTAYGGARGGGKSWAVRVKAIAGALQYPGIHILVMRRTYPELESTIIMPMLELLRSTSQNETPAGDRLFSYHSTMRIIFFANGSTVKFGHLQSANSIGEYQGQEYDWIFMDEATHFTQWEFRTLAATLRGVNQIPKRMYLTCNPGGVGHQWVKRLFVSREFEGQEKPDDYLFIPATVEDNTALMEHSPEYLQMLDLLPEDIRAAHRYGDWDALAGQYFPEFRRELHVVPSFSIPQHWPKYRCFDYGLDMCACYWFTVDQDNRVWVYREYCESGKIVSQAAQAMITLTPPDETVQYTVAPPDMWSTQKDSGRTMAEIFESNGVGLVKSSNARVQGWLVLKEFLKLRPDGKPGLLITEDCPRLIRDLSSLQRDDKNPSDAATQPHDITHAPDALRYGMVYRTLAAESPITHVEPELPTYDQLMTGGEASTSYLIY